MVVGCCIMCLDGNTLIEEADLTQIKFNGYDLMLEKWKTAMERCHVKELLHEIRH